MGFTNFPFGVTSFGIPMVGSGEIPATLLGKYFFVDSVTGISSNDGLSPTTALATVDQAVNKCTASKGDVIVVLPGHVETLATASVGIVLDVAGVTVVGLGSGNARPTFTQTIA